MKIHAKQLFEIVHLVETELVKARAFDADGDLVVVSPESYAVLVADIEKELVTQGLPVPAKLDKFIQGLPALVELIG